MMPLRAKVMQLFCLYSTDFPGGPTCPFRLTIAGTLPVIFSGS